MKTEFREFCNLLKSNGYDIKRIKGSHYIFSNGEKTIAVNKDLNKLVKRRLIKENRLEGITT